MITICLDTSFSFLTVGLLENDHILYRKQQKLPRQQSEEVFVFINEALQAIGRHVKDIDAFVVTRGPGSYTGVRIAMTIAKVAATVSTVEVYTLSTLQLIMGRQTGFAFIDARSQRIYGAHIEAGRLLDEAIYPLAYLSTLDDTVMLQGDLTLLGRAAITPDYVQNFLDLKDQWVHVDTIAALVPTYLKDQSEYG